MFSVVEISECPSASWMTFIFTPASHILVVNVCLSEWQLKWGSNTSGSSLCKNCSSLQSRIILRIALLSVAWCCAWPKRLMKIKSVYPSIVTSQWSPKSSCFCFSCSNVSLAAFGITLWPLLPIVTVPHKCLPIGAGAIFISSTLLSWWTSESIVTP